MGNNKHTPGPWEYRNGSRVYYAVNGAEIASVETQGSLSIMRNNAKLIAAAPDLLEACKSALALIQISTDYKDMSTAKELMAAIAKAEGEEVRS